MLRYLKILERLEVEIWRSEGVGVAGAADVKGRANMLMEMGENA